MQRFSLEVYEAVVKVQAWGQDEEGECGKEEVEVKPLGPRSGLGLAGMLRATGKAGISFRHAYFTTLFLVRADPDSTRADLFGQEEEAGIQSTNKAPELKPWP